MNAYDLNRLLYLIVWLILLLPVYLARRQGAHREWKNVAIWALIVAVLLIFWALFH